jgi:hypothetical protein
MTLSEKRELVEKHRTHPRWAIVRAHLCGARRALKSGVMKYESHGYTTTFAPAYPGPNFYRKTTPPAWVNDVR